MAYRFIQILQLSLLSIALSVIFQQKSSAKNMVGRSPIFIENRGQVTDQLGKARNDIDFKLSATNGLSIFIGNGQLHYQWVEASHPSKILLTHNQEKDEPTPVKMYRMDVKLIGANPDALLSSEQQAAYSERYYLSSIGLNGTTAHSFQKIIYHDVYPHIDWVFYFNENHKLEHDFIVRPGGNLADIKLQYEGATNLQLKTDGSLFASTPLGNISEKAPYAYVLENGQEVKTAFALQGNMLSFSTGVYSGTIVIDPIIDWGTYFGGTDVDAVYDNTIGKDGMVYATGGTSSTNNIATTGAYETTFAGGNAYFNDAFISKFDPSGNCIWSTYYGTASEDISKSISCDTIGNIFIAGYTFSTTGLATNGSHQAINNGGYDTFIAGFDTSGQRLWGTYYGGEGDDGGYGPVALHCDRFNNIYLCGQTNSTTGIATTNAYQASLYSGAGDQDAFLAKFNTSGLLQWATYFGGNFGDAAYGVSNDTLGSIYIAGNTNSTSGIASVGQITNAGGYDAFVAKFNSSGTKLWGTYLGGNFDEYATSITCDSAANIYLTGLTTSTSGLATSNAHQTLYGGGYQDAMLAKFTNAGTLAWATYYGGNSEDQGDKVVCAANGGVYMSGFTGSDTGIVAGDIFQTALGGAYDGLLAKFDISGSLIWGSYLGGMDADEAFCVAADPGFNLYVGGNTTSATGISTLNSWQSTYGGGDYDAFLMRLKDCIPPSTIDTIFGSLNVCAGTTNVYNVNPIGNATSYLWILPNGWTGSSTTTSLSATNNGSSGMIRLMAENSCSTSDTTTLQITVAPLPLIPQIIRNGNVLSINQSYDTYQWNNNGVPISGATNATYAITGNGIYSVSVGNSEGCSITSEPLTIKATSTNTVLSPNGITIYPNPASSIVNIHVTENAVVSFFDIEGKLLRMATLKRGVNKVDIASANDGIYLLRFSDANGNSLGNCKIIKGNNN